MPAQILICDDDTMFRDILKHILRSRGHSVSETDNGWTAVERLQKIAFDLVIVDYYMPVVDGMTVARKARELIGRGPRPHFIGVTADPDGLEGRDPSHGIFDKIVQKPINIPAFLDVIETSLRDRREQSAADKILDLWQDRGFDRCPRVRFASEPSSTTCAALDTVFDLTRPENPDIILLTDGAAPQHVGELRTAGNLFCLPAVDMTGRMTSAADTVFRPDSQSSWSDVAACAKAFMSRRTQLTHRFINASELSEQLLAYIFVSGRDLSPATDPTQAFGLSYSGMFPADRVFGAAEALVGRGLLRRSRSRSASHAPASPRYELSARAIEKLTGTPSFEVEASGNAVELEPYVEGERIGHVERPVPRREQQSIAAQR